MHYYTINCLLSRYLSSTILSCKVVRAGHDSRWSDCPDSQECSGASAHVYYYYTCRGLGCPARLFTSKPAHRLIVSTSTTPFICSSLILLRTALAT